MKLLCEFVRRWPRWALAVWVVLVVAIVLRIALAGPNSGTVVPIYLKAGERWIAGENIYAAFWPLDVYRNPPGVAAFFAPWSLLPPKLAGILWRLMSLAIYLGGLAAFVRVHAEQLTSDRFGWFVVAAGFLVIPSLNNGQVNLLIVGCLLMAAANLERDGLGRAAAWIAFASFFKIYPLAAGMLFCIVKPRLAPRLALASVLAALLPFACQKLDYVAGMHQAFVEFTQLERQFRLLLDRPPWDWTILLRAWFDYRVPDSITKAVDAAVGIAFALVLLRGRLERCQSSKKPLPLAFSLACIWMTLFGPATENATYTLLAPSAALLLLGPIRPSTLAVLVLLALPILRGLFPSSEILPFRTAQSCGTLILLATLLRQALHSEQSEPESIQVLSRVATVQVRTDVPARATSH